MSNSRRFRNHPRTLLAIIGAAFPVIVGAALAGTALANWQIGSSGELSAPMSAPCSGATCTSDHLSFIVAPAFVASSPHYTTTSLGTFEVAVKDASGATVTDDVRTIQLSINQNSGDFSCAGPLTETTTNGVATFTGCQETVLGSHYVITAGDVTPSATALAPTHTPQFVVTSGPATQIHLWWSCQAFPCPPATWGVGIPFSYQPAVQVQDAQGRTVSSDNSTQATLSLTSGPGSLSCTSLTMTVFMGWAHFSGCQVDAAGNYTLTATSSPQGWQYSRTFTATGPGTPTQLAFISYPPSTTYGYLGTIRVAIEDAYGTVITADTRTITLLTSGYGVNTTDFTCSGGLSEPAVSGVATFSACREPTLGTNYYLGAWSQVGDFFVFGSYFNVVAAPPPAPAPVTPQIALAVSANPTSLTGSGSVTFTYSVTNPGSVALSGVTVADTTCSPATYSAGDANANSLLDPGETWTYTCTATLSATTTDSARASGTGNGTTVTASAGTTVTVASPTLTPVTITDLIARGIDRGTAGFGTKSLVVPAGSYVTVLAKTSPNLTGSLVQIWVKTKTSDWRSLTLRRVAADGTVHYFARVDGWTAYRVEFPGDSTQTAAAGHGRIAASR